MQDTLSENLLKHAKYLNYTSKVKIAFLVKLGLQIATFFTRLDWKTTLNWNEFYMDEKIQKLATFFMQTTFSKTTSKNMSFPNYSLEVRIALVQTRKLFRLSSFLLLSSRFGQKPFKIHQDYQELIFFQHSSRFLQDSIFSLNIFCIVHFLLDFC